MRENKIISKGKLFAARGFMLSIVGLLLSLWFTLASTTVIAGKGNLNLIFLGLLLGLLISITSILLSVMGISKLGKTGLGIAGLVIGILSSGWSAIWIVVILVQF